MLPQLPGGASGSRGSMEVGESDVPNPIESNAVVTDIGQRIFDQVREEVT